MFASIGIACGAYYNQCDGKVTGIQLSQSGSLH
jgi:hypothetical protein